MKLNLVFTLVVLVALVAMHFGTAKVTVAHGTVEFDSTLSANPLVICGFALLFNLGYLKQISNKVELAISASFTAAGFVFLTWLGHELSFTPNGFDNNLAGLIALVCGLPPLFIGLKAITQLRRLETEGSAR